MNDIKRRVRINIYESISGKIQILAFPVDSENIKSLLEKKDEVIKKSREQRKILRKYKKFEKYQNEYIKLFNGNGNGNGGVHHNANENTVTTYNLQRIIENERRENKEIKFLLKNQLNGFKKQLSDLEIDIQQVSELERQNENLKDRNEKLLDKLWKLENEKIENENRLKIKKESFENVISKEIDKFSVELDKYYKGVVNIENLFKKTKSSEEKKYKSLKDNTVRLRNASKKSFDTNRKFKSELKKKEKLIEKLNKEIKNSKSKLKNETQNFSTQIKNMIQKFNERILNQQIDNDDLKKETLKVKTRYKNRIKKLQDVVKTRESIILPCGGNKFYGLQYITPGDIDMSNSDKKINFLGRGKYGNVVKAKWNDFEVAVKTIDLDEDDVKEKNINNEAIKRELGIMAMMRNFPGFVKMYGYFIDKERSRLGIVMECYDYNLSRAIRRGLLKSIDKWEAINKIISRLVTLHSRGILHRDLKANNVLIKKFATGRMEYYISDFGMSKIKLDSAFSVTGEIGNERWLAPEILSGSNPTYSFKSDVFSFGMTVLEILTGNLPWSRIKNYREIAKLVQRGKKPPILGKIPSKWKKFIKKCCEKKIKNRPTFDSITRYINKNKKEMIKTLIEKDKMFFEKNDKICESPKNSWKDGGDEKDMKDIEKVARKMRISGSYVNLSHIDKLEIVNTMCDFKRKSKKSLSGSGSSKIEKKKGSKSSDRIEKKQQDNYSMSQSGAPPPQPPGIDELKEQEKERLIKEKENISKRRNMIEKAKKKNLKPTMSLQNLMIMEIKKRQKSMNKVDDVFDGENEEEEEEEGEEDDETKKEKKDDDWS